MRIVTDWSPASPLIVVCTKSPSTKRHQLALLVSFHSASAENVKVRSCPASTVIASFSGNVTSPGPSLSLSLSEQPPTLSAIASIAVQAIARPIIPFNVFIVV